MGKYDPLRDYLLGCDSDHITLSFAEIEAIIGYALPPSAGAHDAWWANSKEGTPSGHSHARAWLTAGYRARADREAGTVRFSRPDAPKEVSEQGPVPHPDDPAPGRRIALIGCAKQKRDRPCPAREMYAPSTLFSLSYRYARQNADRVYILSAKYGLVPEDAVIEPYDETLNGQPPARRREWSEKVLDQLARECDIREDHFILLAGRDYCEYLLPRLPHATLPLGRLPLGKRIEFLHRHTGGNADGAGYAALRLHQLFERLPRYSWKNIDAIPFENGIYIVYERGETFQGYARVVRVGTHTSQNRLKQRLKDHFVREDHNASIFRKNIGKALLRRARDPYLETWSLDTSRPGNIDRANRMLEAQIENSVSDYMRKNLCFSVFPVETAEERLRLEEAIIATLHRAEDFRASDTWLGLDSPEREIRESGMWLKQCLNAAPLTPVEALRLQHILSGVRQ